MTKSAVPKKEENQKIVIENSKEKKFVQKVSIILAIFIILAVGFFYLNNYISVRTNLTTSYLYTDTPTPLPTSITTPTPKPWKFTLLNAKTNIEITEFTLQNYNSVAQWNDYLFFRDVLGETRKLAVYNLKTNEKFTYDLAQYQGERLGLDEFQILENDLYLSFGAYLAEGALYYISLPPKADSSIIKLVSGSNPKIQKIEGRYFVVSGEGDSCWGERDYSLFDPITKKVTFIVTSHIGCNYGDEFLGFDLQKRMIIANHLEDPENTDQNNGNYTNKYTYFYAIDLSKPTEKEILLSEADMPKGIWQIAYKKENNQILLSGQVTYIFDIVSKQLTKSIKIPEEETNKTITPTPELPYEKQKEEEMKKKLDALKLPPEYKIVKN